MAVTITNFHGVNETVWGLPGICMMGMPSICTDHDNAVHVTMSIGMLAMNAIAVGWAVNKWSNFLRVTCALKVHSLWIHNIFPYANRNTYTRTFSSEARDFMKESYCEPPILPSPGQ